MWETHEMVMNLLVFLLVLGISVRLYIQNQLLAKIHLYLFEADQQKQQEITEFMEGFSEAITVFMENEANVQSNAEAIREWDES